jgi:hypothetical protein
MFDSDEELPPAGAARLAGLIEQNHAELKAAECKMLQLKLVPMLIMPSATSLG